jgi:hypothetical protein
MRGEQFPKRQERHVREGVSRFEGLLLGGLLISSQIDD